MLRQHVRVSRILLKSRHEHIFAVSNRSCQENGCQRDKNRREAVLIPLTIIPLTESPIVPLGLRQSDARELPKEREFM